MKIIKLGEYNLVVNAINVMSCKNLKDASIRINVSTRTFDACLFLSFQTDEFWHILIRTQFSNTEKGMAILDQIHEIGGKLAYKIEKDFIKTLKNMEKQAEDNDYDYNKNLKKFENSKEAKQIKELVKEFVKSYNEMNFFKRIILSLL